MASALLLSVVIVTSIALLLAFSIVDERLKSTMKKKMLSMSYSIANNSDLSELKDFQMSNRQEISNKSASGPHHMNLSGPNEVRSQLKNYSRIALVVLGMHRSGTSMLTNLLSHSGFSLPKTLINATKENQKGHFESFPVVRLNEKMMREEFEMEWFSPACGLGTNHTKNVTGVLSKYKQQAIALIHSEFAEAENIVLKDPRISVLYEFWSDVLFDCGYTPKPIIAIRHPAEVAMSLSRRNRLYFNQSLDLWLHYSLAAERSTRGGPRALILHSDLMQNWRGSLKKIEAVLGVPLLIHSRASSARDTVVSKELSSRRAFRHGPIPPRAQAAFDWFLQSARGASPGDAAIDRIWAECAAAQDSNRVRPPERPRRRSSVRVRKGKS